LIGREHERALLESAVARALDGGPVFPLVVGEPGIGKTTLLRELSGLAADGGFAVGYGRAEADGAGPLWVWTSALRDSCSDGGPTGRSDQGGFGGARLEPFALVQGGERFAAFEEFARELIARSTNRPLALLLDDLQWADVSALRLLRHLLDRPPIPRILIAGGLRTTEPLTADAVEIVSGVLAHPSVELVEMRAFDPCETAAFMAEHLARPPGDDEVALLTRRSGGNPFLLGELLRWIPRAGTPAGLDDALPLAVRESVRRRLVVEDASTQQVVKATAVAGVATTVELLATATQLHGDQLGQALDTAMRAGLLVIGNGHGDAPSFTHDLVRHAVLSLLPTWDRIQLHHAIGMALRERPAASSWAAVATHLRAAQPLVDRVVLRDVAIAAAAEARATGAYDEAAEHLGTAIELTDAGAEGSRRGELLVERGRLLWAAQRAAESDVALNDAVDWARRTNDADLLAQVALSWRGGDRRAVNRRPDAHLVALLREALAARQEGDSAVRCLLLARLVRCGFWDISDREVRAMADEAVAMARRLEEPTALAEALATQFYCCWKPELAVVRLAIADEMLAAAVLTDEQELIAEASSLRLMVLLELGRLREAWGELERFDDAAAGSRQPILNVRMMWLHATRQLAIGDRQAADELADRACELAERMGRPDVAIERLGQALLLAAGDGAVEQVLPMFGPGLIDADTYHAIVALANGLAGRQIEARAALDVVMAGGLDRFPRDMAWLFGACGLLAAAVVAGDRHAGELLYGELEPFAGQWAVLNPGIMVAGAVDHFLGLGAALLDRIDIAVEHFRRAAAAHEAEGAVPLAIGSLHELCAVLTRRGRPDAAAEIDALRRRIGLLASRSTVPTRPLLAIVWSSAPAVPAHEVQRLVCEGDTWVVEFAGARARLRDQRGLHHLRALLEHPGMEIPAVVLAGADHAGASGEAPILDDRAMRDYRRQIADLQAEVDEATANNDLARVAMAEAQLEAFVHHLAAATGVGGRPRQFTGADERARVSVTKAIRATITHVGELLPELARHLAATVHTGGRCVYQPDPRVPHRWQMERM
jgi:hypothetical protein